MGLRVGQERAPTQSALAKAWASDSGQVWVMMSATVKAQASAKASALVSAPVSVPLWELSWELVRVQGSGVTSARVLAGEASVGWVAAWVASALASQVALAPVRAQYQRTRLPYPP